jgi:hypothetical protein
VGAQLWTYDAAADDFNQLGQGSGEHDDAAFDALWVALNRSELTA